MKMEETVMLQMLEFSLVIGIIMILGYTFGGIVFRLMEKYHAKKND
jgi:hypothetical protein